jgi:hypothetical protein
MILGNDSMSYDLIALQLLYRTQLAAPSCFGPILAPRDESQRTTLPFVVPQNKVVQPLWPSRGIRVIQMGIDGLDIIFRLERAFNVTIPAGRIYWSDEQRRLNKFDRRTTVTVGEMHHRMCDLLREMKHSVPDNSWDRVAKCVGDALQVAPTSIKPQDRLIEDLGAT